MVPRVVVKNGLELKKRRRELNASQRQFADAARHDPKIISAFEGGQLYGNKKDWDRLNDGLARLEQEGTDAHGDSC